MTSTSFPQQQQDRLSHKEQQHLLSLAVEARRIRQIQMTTTGTDSKLRLARDCGYESAHAVQQALDEGAQARETLVTRNMGLVYYTVQNLWNPQMTIPKEDLIQEGAIGLARAVDKWNVEVGGRFSTYAMYWIRALILRHVAERNDVVRVPAHVNEAVQKVSKAATKLGLPLMDTSGLERASWTEAQAAKALAEEAGLTDRQVQEALKVKKRRRMGPLSFESWMQQGRDLDSDTGSVNADVERSTLEREDFTRVLSRFLRPKEMEALSWRYGLIQAEETMNTSRNYAAEAEKELFGPPSSPPPAKGRWGEAMSFTEVGKHMHVSAEYGRKLCHRALDKLRRAAEDGSLEPAWMM